MTEQNYFTELAKIDVGNYIEKKGQFSYLSWAWAVDQLKRFDADATWDTKWFKDPQTGIDIPYSLGPNGAFVQVSVTVKGRTHSQIQPVMDFKNKAIQNPDAMDVNKAIQRCLVKAIALHGLGLYIYAGEDLPNDLISGSQLNAINKQAERFAELRGQTVEAVIEALGVGSIAHLTSAQANLVLNKVANWVAKAEEALQAKATPAKETEEEVKEPQAQEA